MPIDFFSVDCQSASTKKTFGLCDDPPPASSPAYIDEKNYQKKIGINPSAIQHHINTLKELVILKRVGPDKDGHWKVTDTY